MKLCKKCCREYPEEFFSKDLKAKDGLTSSCKSCAKKRALKWQKGNPEKYRNYHKEYYHKNKEKVKIKSKNYYDVNKISLLKKSKEYRIKNKDSIKDSRLFRKYNSSLPEFDEIIKKQHGVCAICGKKETQSNQYGKQPLSVDHNHKTGKIRGLLCVNCNHLLGKAKENPFILIKTVKYLKKYKDQK